MKKELTILGQFQLPLPPVSVEPLGAGHINDSFRVRTSDPRVSYVLQRINDSVFREVDLLQRNITAVTGHIRRKLVERGETDTDRKVLNFYPAADSKTYTRHEGEYWRVMFFIPGSTSLEEVTPASSYDAGRAFGDFQAMLCDLPQELGETIPDFHNMEFRLEQLRDAVREDKAGRAGGCKDMIEALLSRGEGMCLAERMHRRGLLPKRVCHCDTKVNNMLFDNEGRVLCVVDLDTVMPSFVFSDIGDFLRTGAATAPEDEPDISRVGFDMEIFRSFIGGYLETAGTFLTPTEIEMIPYAAALFPYMQTVRFLADYLNGDTYYKTAYPEHNLVRARAQFRLTERVEELQGEMARTVGDIMWCK